MFSVTTTTWEATRFNCLALKHFYRDSCPALLFLLTISWNIYFFVGFKELIKLFYWIGFCKCCRFGTNFKQGVYLRWNFCSWCWNNSTKTQQCSKLCNYVIILAWKLGIQRFNLWKREQNLWHFPFRRSRIGFNENVQNILLFNATDQKRTRSL